MKFQKHQINVARGTFRKILFEPILEKIKTKCLELLKVTLPRYFNIDVIRVPLQGVDELDYIFVVGGFAKSKILVSYFQNLALEMRKTQLIIQAARSCFERCFENT